MTKVIIILTIMLEPSLERPCGSSPPKRLISLHEPSIDDVGFSRQGGRGGCRVDIECKEGICIGMIHRVGRVANGTGAPSAQLYGLLWMVLRML